MTCYENQTHKVEFLPSVLLRMQDLYSFSCTHKCEVLACMVGCYSADRTTAIVQRLECVSRGEFAEVARDALLMTNRLKWIWNESNGRVFFVGEWHTHPLNSNAPSQIDIDTARDTATDGAAKCPQFIMAISGLEGLGVHIVTKDTISELKFCKNVRQRHGLSESAPVYTENGRVLYDRE
jgi:hypothetical protein